MPDVIVVNPHRCISQQSDDPGCDLRSYEYGKAITDKLKKSKVDAVYLTSEDYRSASDANRSEGSNLPIRKKLRSYLSQSPNAKVLEVHSYDPNTVTKSWNTPYSKPAVVFNLRNSKYENALRKNINAGKVSGDTVVNDISREAQEKNWNHSLLEIRDDGKHFDQTLSGIVKTFT